MKVIVSYRVDKDAYEKADKKHDITLITTEYTNKSSLLVHLQIGRNLGIRINNLLSYNFKKDAEYQNEQFLYKKAYNKGKPKKVTRSTFEEKLAELDMSQTKVEREILEEYSYKNERGKDDNVQIVIRENSNEMTATIDFNSVEQIQLFVSPVWLSQMTE